MSHAHNQSLKLALPRPLASPGFDTSVLETSARACVGRGGVVTWSAGAGPPSGV
jgi:hypothetical protein